MIEFLPYFIVFALAVCFIIDKYWQNYNQEELKALKKQVFENFSVIKHDIKVIHKFDERTRELVVKSLKLTRIALKKKEHPLKKFIEKKTEPSESRGVDTVLKETKDKMSTWT